MVLLLPSANLFLGFYFAETGGQRGHCGVNQSAGEECPWIGCDIRGLAQTQAKDEDLEREGVRDCSYFITFKILLLSVDVDVLKGLR